MARSYLHTLNAKELPPNCGRKADQIQRLFLYDKICVPFTYVCIWDAYEAWERGDKDILQILLDELSQKLDLSGTFAVRSSANVEDGFSFSFAGQFNSYLHRKGRDNLLEAIQNVWQSAQNADLDTYLAKTAHTVDKLKMAVILQQMIKPVVSGVSFNKNPITGLDEIVVEAVTGTGEALVQEGITPDRWIYKWGSWISKPQESAIDDGLISQVVDQTMVIAKANEGAVDLEWVYNGKEIYWIQMRGITSLDHHNIYSNRMAREMLPGIIKPLIWSVNTQLINSVWIDIFTELIGPNEIKPEDLAKSFYYRAYFNMGTIGRIFEALGMPRDLLELMMGMQGGDQQPKFRPSKRTMRHIPRMVRFMLSKIRFGNDIDAFLTEMDRQYAKFASQDLSQLSDKEILDEIDNLFLFTKRAAYRNIVGPLLMHTYDNLLHRRLDKHGIEHENFDLMNNFSEIEDYDPNLYLDSLAKSFAELDEQLQNQIRLSSYADMQAIKSASEFQESISIFLNHFGHLSDSGNDFSCTPWRENPDLVLQMIVNRASLFMSEANGSHADDLAPQKLTWEELPLGGLNRLQTRWLYRRARQFRYYREATSFKYTYGYGLFRNYFLALADGFVEKGVMKDRQDIFLLFLDEIRSIVVDEFSVNVQTLAADRKDEISDVEDVILPEIIYGDEAPPLEIYDDNRRIFTGIPTSGGYFRGPVRVVRSLNEFKKMIPGAVLVIPYSDISWVPLFAQAGAIIAESGGILSHSSIVAREYHLPAIVSITNACHLLKDDMIVTVDGFKGEVILN